MAAAQQSQSPQSPPQQAFIVTLVQTPARQTTIVDVVVGSLGIAGALFLLALVLGGALSLVFLAWNRRHPPEEDHLPPVR